MGLLCKSPLKPVWEDLVIWKKIAIAVIYEVENA